MVNDTMSSYALPSSFPSRPFDFTIIPVKARSVVGILPYSRIKFPLDKAGKSLHLPSGETAEQNLLRPRGTTSSTRALCSPDDFQRLCSPILPTSHSSI